VVASFGQEARVVQQLSEARGQPAQVTGADAAEGEFTVASRLASQPRHTLADSLGAVFDYFWERRG
jgi:hypothetical protein